MFFLLFLDFVYFSDSVRRDHRLTESGKALGKGARCKMD